MEKLTLAQHNTGMNRVSAVIPAVHQPGLYGFSQKNVEAQMRTMACEIETNRSSDTTMFNSLSGKAQVLRAENLQKQDNFKQFNPFN